MGVKYMTGQYFKYCYCLYEMQNFEKNDDLNENRMGSLEMMPYMEEWVITELIYSLTKYRT